MKQELVDGLKAYYAALVGISTAKRWDLAIGLLTLEHATQAAPGPSEPMRWFGVTDMGMISEEELRQLLLANGYLQWQSADVDTVMVEFAMRYGKVVTPIDQEVPPFYLINGARESIYLLRLRAKEKYLDWWNTAPREQVVQALRDAGDAIQEL